MPNRVKKKKKKTKAKQTRTKKSKAKKKKKKYKKLTKKAKQERMAALGRKRKVSDADLDLIDAVEREGWAVVVEAETKQRSGYAYTVGLWYSFNHPELIVLGMDWGDPEGLMPELLNELGQRIAEGKQFVALEDRLEDLLEDHAFALRDVAPKQYSAYLEKTIWFYGNREFPALQLCWPDPEGDMPWEEAFQDKWRWFQPVLD